MAEVAIAPPAAAAAPKINPQDDDPLYSEEIEQLDDGKPAPDDEKPKGDKPSPKKPDEPEPEEEEEEDADKDKGKDKADPENDEIDKLDVVENPDADPNKPADKPEEKPADKPEEKPGKEPRAKELKIHYEAAKKDLKATREQLDEATKTIEELKRANPDEVRSLLERAKKAETERDDLESRLRDIDYQQSEEYKTKYDAPYRDAWADALAELAEVPMMLENGETGQPGPQELLELAQTDLPKAWKMARDKFGEFAPIVMQHRAKLINLSKAQNKAVAEAKATSKAKQDARIAEERAIGEKLSKLWKETNGELQKKYPRWYGPVEGDADGNALLEKGYQEVDRFFNDAKLPPEERVKLHARIRGKAANHDRMALRLKRTLERLKKIATDLKQYEDSAPPSGKGRRSAPAGNGNWADEADKEIQALDDGS